MTQAFPLQWPHSRKRTVSRKRAAFGKRVQRSGQSWQSKESLTINDAVTRLREELGRLGAREYVLSSNLVLRNDGLPRSDQRAPSDPGVCLYFTLKGEPYTFPCDTYDRVADNIAAIAKHIEATRDIERYGVATLKEMFTGFAALPAPEAKRPWREVLGLRPDWHGSIDGVDAAFRNVARNVHPDRPGGSHEAMTAANAARDAAIREIGN